MVDVSEKRVTQREAVAVAHVALPAATAAVLQAQQGRVAKGDPLAVAELAGIMAAKKTSELIPLCHPLPLTKVTVVGSYAAAYRRVSFTATCRVSARTGVEMEALTAASVAALTFYDMLKSMGKEMVIEEVKLLKKSGGASGTWTA